MLGEHASANCTRLVGGAVPTPARMRCTAGLPGSGGNRGDSTVTRTGSSGGAARPACSSSSSSSPSSCCCSCWNFGGWNLLGLGSRRPPFVMCRADPTSRSSGHLSRWGGRGFKTTVQRWTDTTSGLQHACMGQRWRGEQAATPSVLQRLVQQDTVVNLKSWRQPVWSFSHWVS